MKHTKHKLLSSIATLVVCIAMLIGSTYAWFTDSASTGVNKIQAGNLDIKVEYLSNPSDNSSWTEIDVDKKLFNDNALWEPGYAEIAYLKIANAGNLHLKYKLSVDTRDKVIGTSVNGTPIDLSQILKFGKIESSDAPTPYSNDSVGRQQALSAVSNNASILSSYTKENLDLAPGASEYVTLVVYMPTNIGNEANYRGDAVPSIKLGVNVVATQATNESDSFDNQYDKDALYPILAPVINNTVGSNVTLDAYGKTNSSQSIVITDEKATSKIPAATLIYGGDGTNPVATSENGKLNREIKTTDSTSDSVTYDISYKYVAANGTSTDITKFGNVIENVIDVSTGLNIVKVTHSHGSATREMTLAQDINSKADGTYYYDSQNGKIYVWSSEYSSFKVEYESDFVAAIDGQGYATLEEALNAVRNDGVVTLLKDVNLSSDVGIGSGTKNINFNMNGKTLDCGNGQVYTAGNGTITIFGGGTIKNNNTTSANSGYAALNIFSGTGNVVLDGVTVEGYYGIYTKGNLTIKKATINAVDCGIAINGSANVNVGTELDNNISVSASQGNCISTQAADGNSAMVVNVYGGSFISAGSNWKMSPIYWASHGTLNVYGGSFVNSTSGTEAAGLYQKNGTVNIYDGHFESRCGLKLGAEEINSTEITMNIFNGTFTGTTHAALYYKTTASGSNCTTYNINVSGGVFNGNEFEGAIKNSLKGSIVPTVSVTGGTFSSDPSKYVAVGYEAVQGENGQWTIVENSGDPYLITWLESIDFNGSTLPALEEDVDLSQIESQIFGKHNITNAYMQNGNLYLVFNTNSLQVWNPFVNKFKNGDVYVGIAYHDGITEKDFNIYIASISEKNTHFGYFSDSSNSADNFVVNGTVS